MKLQDLYKYDSALYGLSNTYTPVGDDAFFINYQSIIAYDHTLFTGSVLLNDKGKSRRHHCTDCNPY